MIKIGDIRVNISNCITGVYLRWWFNGWHYFNFTNGYEITMVTQNKDIQVTKMFSIISKIERPTKLTEKYSYQITLQGIQAANIAGFTGLLQAERVEQYEGGKWYEVDITRGDHVILEEDSTGYILDFEITRNELPNTPAVYQKTLKLYLNDSLCDMDDDENVPLNKQTNDIAEMQDRQSDFTAQFKIRKTRAMRSIFELSGDVGANTMFPYTNQYAKLVQDNIEMITAGKLILDKVDDQYYNVSIYSGNLDFFTKIENLKLNDLTLASTNHTWDKATMVASNIGSLDYVYPLCEPSDDARIAPLTDDGSRVEMYGGWIWPFIKVKAIWDEIFLNAGYTPTGTILTDDTFLKLFMPIVNTTITQAYSDSYLYASFRRGFMAIGVTSIFGTGGTGEMSLVNGTPLFATGHYLTPFTAVYKIRVDLLFLSGAPTILLYQNGFNVGTFSTVSSDATHMTCEITYSAASGVDLAVWGTANTYFGIYVTVTDISNPVIGFGSPFVSRLFLPDTTQTDFIKMVCNLFGLIPEAVPRDRKIKFWNYSELYDNIPNARDWSAYLSEREDEITFKFGDYAQNNYLKYKDSDDVIKDNGKGDMEVNDETLPLEKDVVELPVSTCDEVEVLSTIDISRIAFNKYDTSVAGNYKQVDKIDPRLVYVKQVTGKTFAIRATVMPGAATDIVNPKVASSMEVSFSRMVINYAGLSRMLTMTNLRSAKFNLPVYEVAGLKHYIPIYLSQYKAYFYVNKINNYVPGQLCTIDLIKL